MLHAACRGMHACSSWSHAPLAVRLHGTVHGAVRITVDYAHAASSRIGNMCHLCTLNRASAHMNACAQMLISVAALHRHCCSALRAPCGHCAIRMRPRSPCMPRRPMHTLHPPPHTPRCCPCQAASCMPLQARTRACMHRCMCCPCVSDTLVSTGQRAASSYGGPAAGRACPAVHAGL